LASYYRRAREGDRDAAQKVIDHLIAHPYLIPREQMARLRGRCWDVLGLRRAATFFFRDAWRFNPDNPHDLLAYLISLGQEGRYAEAWEIVEDQLEKHPGAPSSIYAMSVINAILAGDRDSKTLGDDVRQRKRDEILEHFDSMIKACQSMDPGERKEIAPLIDRAFLIAWVPYGEVNGAEKQSALIDRWIELSPDSSHARALREIVSSPTGASRQDVHDGIRQAEDYINEYAAKRFEEMSPILDASVV
jgi:hypothetical protein